jgi:hypothetical protein
MSSLGNLSRLLGGLQPYAAQLLAVGTRESYRQSGTFGANVTSYDLSGLDCDARGGFIAVFQGKSLYALSAILKLRINGSVLLLDRAGSYGASGVAPSMFGDAGPVQSPYNHAYQAIGTEWSMVVSCDLPISGRNRVLHAKFGVQSDKSTNAVQISEYATVWKSTDQITKVGLETTLAGDLAAASTFTIVRI